VVVSEGVEKKGGVEMRKARKKAENLFSKLGSWKVRRVVGLGALVLALVVIAVLPFGVVTDVVLGRDVLANAAREGRMTGAVRQQVVGKLSRSKRLAKLDDTALELYPGELEIVARNGVTDELAAEMVLKSYMALRGRIFGMGGEHAGRGQAGGKSGNGGEAGESGDTGKRRKSSNEGGAGGTGGELGERLVINIGDFRASIIYALSDQLKYKLSQLPECEVGGTAETVWDGLVAPIQGEKWHETLEDIPECRPAGPIYERMTGAIDKRMEKFAKKGGHQVLLRQGQGIGPARHLATVYRWLGGWRLWVWGSAAVVLLAAFLSAHLPPTAPQGKRRPVGFGSEAAGVHEKRRGPDGGGGPTGTGARVSGDGVLGAAWTGGWSMGAAAGYWALFVVLFILIGAYPKGIVQMLAGSTDVPAMGVKLLEVFAWAAAWRLAVGAVVMGAASVAAIWIVRRKRSKEAHG
jgi:hypothetical protein